MKTDNSTTNFSARGSRLAIIGIGCLFPKADDRHAYWANIMDGVDAITEVPETHWPIAEYYDHDPKSPDRTYGRRGGFISPVAFNPMEFNIPPNILEAVDTSQLLGLVAAGQALKDAGYGPERNFDRSRASVILGVTGTLELVIPLGARLGHPIWRKALKDAGVDEAVAKDVVERISESYVPWQENSFPGLLGNVVAGRISKQFDLGGTNCVVDAACASSMSALHLASMELSSGKSDIVVTGGIDTFNDIFMYMCFSKTPALSPSGNAKPFDTTADGTILGEGLGIIVLKRLCDAEKDGDRIYAVVRGVGSSSDGKGDAIYAPSASGQKKALLDAYANADVTPESIGLIEAHGTGTKVGDAVEVTALREVYGAAERPWCCLGSVKSQIGHAKAAAGAAGIIKAALALHHKVIPPTIKVQKPLPELTSGQTPFYIASRKRPWLSLPGAPRRAGVSAFGFGGSNFHVVLEEYCSEKEAAGWDGNVQLIVFTAPETDTIARQLENIPSQASWSEIRSIAQASRGAYDAGSPYRIALVVEKNRTDLGSLKKNTQAMLAKNPNENWHTPDGAYFGFGKRPGKLGVLFPGQGSQYTGMLNDLACLSPEMLDTLNTANEGFSSPDGRLLSDFIYPISAFDQETAAHDEDELRATQVAQPAIGAVSLGSLKLLTSFGVLPEAVAGHSYGELTALCAAGRIDEASFNRLSRLRGSLMAQGKGDRGSMLAVSAPLTLVEKVIKREKLDLVIANRNAPSQSVLSGATAEIDRAHGAFSTVDIICKKLPVSAAFHSPLVADAASPLRAELSGITLNESNIPVYANTSADLYPQQPDAAKTLLASQLANPVDFVALIEAMYRDGVRTFVETGPGARLTGLVQAILGEKPHTALAIDASAGKRSGVTDLARTLAQLSVLGYQLRLASWDADFRPEKAVNGKKPAMTIPICGANYVKAKPKKPPVVPTRSIAPAATAIPSFTPLTTPVAVTSIHPISAAAEVPPTAAYLPPVSSEALRGSLLATKESMTLLQKMQEDTARLHLRFLEGQEAAGRTFQMLLEQQQRLVLGGAPADYARTPSPFTPQNSTNVAPTASASFIAPTAAAPSSSNQVTQTLLAVISEKTGYPIEMLELDMGMDSDLGIDSIKRVEILSTLKERLPGSPAIGPEHLGALSTLGEIAAHLGAGASQAPSSTAAPARVESATTMVAEAADITETLLAIVSEKTGYPVEMLELDMGMDSDLGIDSIKRVEILSTLRERLPGSPAIGPEHLGTLSTLGEIAGYLSAGAPVPTQAAVILPTASLVVSGPDITRTLLDVVSEKTGYPVEMLELDMGMDSDLGIDSIKRVEILSTLKERLPGSPTIGPEHLGTLSTLGEIASFLAETRGEATRVSTAAPTMAATAPLTEPSPIQRKSVIAVPLVDTGNPEDIVLDDNSEIWVTYDGSPFAAELCGILATNRCAVRKVEMATAHELVPTRKLFGLVICAPVAGCDDQFLEDAFVLLKNASKSLIQTAQSDAAVFVTVSRLDGAFGFGHGTEIVDPVSGGLAGLAKTAALEWPELTCKAIDLGDFPNPAQSASAIAIEIFSTGPVEVGLTPSGRICLTIDDFPVPSSPSPPPLSEGDVVVITGGGRGVTAAAALGLARQFHPLLVLLGRSPVPQPEPAWLDGLTEGAEIKRAIMQRASAKLHPREIEERYQALLAGRELCATLNQIAAAGGSAVYRSIDIRDAAAMELLMAGIRREFGPIRGVVHGAGVLSDRLIADKSPEQFHEVYSTKVSGLRALLNATRNDDLRFIALFSSSTGRFGRIGQVDYAVANEVLNKIAQVEARRRTGCRAVSINWGPWDGGMVSPALKKVFLSEGVGVIGLAEGAAFLAREIGALGSPVEIVALAATEKTGITPIAAQPEELAEAFALTLTVSDYPFLLSHVLDGKAVLPMAVIVEWLAHGALHGNPGFRFHGFNDLRICKGVVFEEHTPFTLNVLAGRAEKRDSFFIVPVELSSVAAGGRPIVHARAEIVLAGRLPEGIRSITEIPTTPYAPADGVIYTSDLLFHGPDLHGIEQVDGCSALGIAATVKGAPAPSSWIKRPLRGSWLTDPLAIDSAFQMMILWSFERFGSGSLPCFAARYRQFQETFPREGVQVVIRVTAESSSGATADIEFLDRHTAKLVARLEGYECVIDASLKKAFKRNQLKPVSEEQGAA